MSIEKQRKVFSENLRRYLMETGRTQKELADAVGVSEGSASDWLNARTYPRMDKLQKIAEFLGCKKLDLIESPVVADVNVNALAEKIIKNPNAAKLFEKYLSLNALNRQFVETVINSLKEKQND